MLINTFKKIKTYVFINKIRSAIGLVILLSATYWGYGKIFSVSGETLYTTTAAAKGTIISSISGSGQVSASDQFDIKPKVSGDVVYVGYQNGQAVGQGGLIAELDTTSAEKAVRDAETSLETAKLSLEKILKPADELSLIQSENSLTSAEQAKSTAEDNLIKAYDDAYTAISNAFINLAPVISGIQNILYSNTNNAGQDNISYYTDLVKNLDSTVPISIYRNSAADNYSLARTIYDKTFLDYKTTNRNADRTSIESLLNETIAMARALADSDKSTSNFLSFVKDRLTERNLSVPAQLIANQTNIDTYTSNTNTYLSNLVSALNTLKNSKNDLQNSASSITEKTQALAKLKAGADSLDIRSAQISVQQRADTLQDAKDNLANYYIRAPFAGIITKISIVKGSSAGSGTAIATLVTNQKLATISLNEIDVSKIKLGQKATITFDAIDGLTITGEVVEIDTIGTVSQGVVTYNVKIKFDTQDDRVKSSMSMSAAIITDVKPDVLVVPNSAVKTSGGTHYVELFTKAMNKSPSATTPMQQAVEIGIFNDTLTEIISGIKEGDNVVTRTVLPTATAPTAAAPSLFGGGGVRVGGGAGFRGN